MRARKQHISKTSSESEGLASNNSSTTNTNNSSGSPYQSKHQYPSFAMSRSPNKRKNSDEFGQTTSLIDERLPMSDDIDSFDPVPIPLQKIRSTMGHPNNDSTHNRTRKDFLNRNFDSSKYNYNRNNYPNYYNNTSSQQRLKENLPSNSSSEEIQTDEARPLIGNTCSNQKRESSSLLCCCNKTLSDKDERIIRFKGNGESTITPDKYFPKNSVNNCKYSIITFLPKFLWEQFSQFGNFYFLMVAFIQIVPEFSIGYWWASWGPLGFVITISMLREIADDLSRAKRDRKVNNKKYEKIHIDKRYDFAVKKEISASKIKIGDLIVLHENERVPCDMILLYCSNPNGATFLRTDQLDGETDWKLRKAVSSIQKQYKDSQAAQLASLQGSLKVEPPHRQLYEFLGTFTNKNNETEPLNLENTLWASTVVAAGTVVGCAIYTGKQTRSQLNTAEKEPKLGRFDIEVNYYAKILFGFLIAITATLTLARGININAPLWLYFVRFILLLSYIIPISLRVYLDSAKIFFSSFKIEKDKKIPETTVRCTTIPEELGRIEYLFTDKTGTLTQNEMIFKKLQLTPPLLYDNESIDIVKQHIKKSFVKNIYLRGNLQDNKDIFENNNNNSLLLDDNFDPRSRSSSYSNISGISYQSNNNPNKTNKVYKSSSQQITDLIEALALCHNVTPIVNDMTQNIDYQASSPDEVALVKFTETIGVTLIYRTNDEMTLKILNKNNKFINLNYQILRIFPFTSESKRMGIIVKCLSTNKIIFFVKGSDSIMKNIVSTNDWLDEETENLAREGLRTLVFGRKYLSNNIFNEFEEQYYTASCSMQNRKLQMESIRERLEQEMELIGITGVEDKLQINVQSTLETLRNANIKIWMLTGDKVETAQVIAKSSRLVSYGQDVFELICNNNSKRDTLHKLDLFGGTNNNTGLIIDGKTLDICLKNYKNQFIEYAVESPIVICCRCSPTQKAEIVSLVHSYTNKITCSIGDGGNDVSMIQKAQVGIGIVGKEGQQASLAADYSITQFEYISRLILWHGRISYKQTAKMAQFVIHRGLIIALLQSIFSAALYYSAIPLFPAALGVGYTCIYTSAPVFSFIMDHDITDTQALFYPELYHSLQKSDSLNNITFLSWILKSFYQGGIIMILSFVFFDKSFHHIISISFTALIVTEMVNISLEIKHWTKWMIIAQIVSLLLYIISMFIFTESFDLQFLITTQFWLSILVTAGASLIPVALIKFIHRKMNPSSHQKLKEMM